MLGALGALVALVLAAPVWDQARCEVETSALSKQEGVRRLCEALTQCTTVESQESAGANALRSEAFTQTARLQQQVALLSKEKATLQKTAVHDALVTHENGELMRSVDVLEQQVTDGRAKAVKAKAAEEAASAAESGAETAAEVARESAAAVVTLRKQLADAEKEGVEADKQRARLEAELLKEASVVTSAVHGLKAAQAAAAKASANAASMQSADAALVKRLATAENLARQLTAEREDVQAVATAVQKASAKEIAALKAQLKHVTADRDAYRNLAVSTATNCTRKVSKLKAAQQAELSRLERLLN